MAHDAVLASLRRELDEKIDKYRYDRRRICGFKTERNLLAPISSLPSELLSLVFVDYVCLFHPSGPSRVDQWSQLITAICSHWRHVALACPDLWAHLYLESPTWTEAMLARSKNFKLVVHCGQKAPDGITVLKLCQKHLDRVRVLSIDWDSMNSLSWWVQPFISLESLQINGYHPNKSTFDKSSLFLDASPFVHSITNLRCLTLNDCSLPWTSPMLSSLMTALKVSCPSVGELNQFGFRFTDLLDAMERMPLMEELSFVCGDFPSLDARLCKHRLVQLKHMQALTLSACLEDIATVLDHIQLPISTTLNLKAKDMWLNATLLGNVIRSIAAQGSADLYYVQSLDLAMYPYSIKVRIGLGVSSKLRMDFHSNTTESGYDIAPQIWHPTTMDLARLQVLRIDFHLPVDSWTQTFGLLPSLEEIHAVGDEGAAASSFIEAMKMLKSQSSFNSMFCALAVLTLHCVGKDQLEDLLVFVRRRHRMKRGIERLWLEEGNLDAFYLNKMKKWVGQIDFYESECTFGIGTDLFA